MKDAIRNRLLTTATAIAASALGAGSLFYVQEANTPSPAVLLAMDIGHHFESSGKHIGKPYIDKVGKGQPWTVCAGITGKGVDPTRYYTPEDCKALETPRYIQAERDAKRALTNWSSYNVWVRASFIDMMFNVPSALAPNTTIRKLANAGRLDAACEQMPRWVYGTVSGKSVQLQGLVDRRVTTAELCAQWGRPGHFSAKMLIPTEAQ